MQINVKFKAISKIVIFKKIEEKININSKLSMLSYYKL